MRNVAVVASSVARDAVRRKVFYVVLLFGIAVVALSPLLPTFELGTRVEFLRDISLSLTSLFGVALAVIMSVGQVSGEVERKTVYNILSKPVSRLQYILGKYIGILLVLAAILSVMGLEVLGLVYFKLGVFSPVIFQGVFAVFLEGAVIAAFCLALSTFASVPVNVFATMLFYMLCHVKTGFLHEKLAAQAAGAVKVVSWALYYLIPNLENFNLSLRVGYGGGASAAFMARTTGYAMVFAAALLLGGYLVFRRRDL